MEASAKVHWRDDRSSNPPSSVHFHEKQGSKEKATTVFDGRVGIEAVYGSDRIQRYDTVCIEIRLEWSQLAANS